MSFCLFCKLVLPHIYIWTQGFTALKKKKTEGRREGERERKRDREIDWNWKPLGFALNPFLPMLWFLRRSHLQTESCPLITAAANSVVVFLPRTGNSFTPGSQHMVLANLVMAALFLSHWELSFAESIVPTPGWPPALYSSMYGGLERSGLNCWSIQNWGSSAQHSWGWEAERKNRQFCQGPDISWKCQGRIRAECLEAWAL